MHDPGERIGVAAVADGDRALEPARALDNWALSFPGGKAPPLSESGRRPTI